MKPTNPQRYTLPAIAIHWLTVALVFFLFGLGWYMTDLPRSPVRGPYFALHKSIGITVFLLLVARFLWRLSHRPPEMPGSLPVWQRYLAGAVHKLFYVFLVLQPLTGYLSSSFSGHSTKFFNIPLPSWGTHDPPLNLLFTEFHEICSYFLLTLIALHVAGAISHAIKKDAPAISRMLPWA